MRLTCKLRRRPRLHAAGRLERRVGRIAQSVATADRKGNEPTGQEPGRRLPVASALGNGPQDQNAGQPGRRVSPGNAATGSATANQSFPRKRGRRLRSPGALMRFPPRAPNARAHRRRVSEANEETPRARRARGVRVERVVGLHLLALWQRFQSGRPWILSPSH